MKTRRYKEAKEKRDGGGFVAFPNVVLDSAAFIGLSAHARMLLFDIASQYSGANNGDLCAAWALMKPRGWKSEDTLAKAKRELLESGLLVETRKGARPNKASLYALTWFALDAHPKLEMTPQSYPRGLYRQRDEQKRLKNVTLATPAEVAASL